MTCHYCTNEAETTFARTPFCWECLRRLFDETAPPLIRHDH